MSSKEAENKSEVERTYVSSGNIMKGMNESSNPGYIHYADIDASYDIQHKTRRRGELFTLSYMLALTRQRTEQENSYTDLQNAPFDYTGKLQNLRELADLWQHRETDSLAAGRLCAVETLQRHYPLCQFQSVG